MAALHRTKVSHSNRSQTESPAWCRENWDLCITVGLAAVVFGIAVTRYATPSMLHDAYAYTMAALRLVRDGVYAYSFGELPGTEVLPDARVTPGYILFLSAIYALIGRADSPILAIKTVQPIVQFVQYLLAVAGVGLLALCGRELGGRRASITVGVMSACYLPFAWSTSVALSESIALPLIAAQLLLTLKITGRTTRWRTWHMLLTYGILTAAVVMLRPSTAAWVLIPLLYVFVMRVESWRRLSILAGVAVLGFALVFTPWWVRNAIVLGKFVPLKTDTVRTAEGQFKSIATDAPPALTPAQRRSAAIGVALTPWNAVDDALWENAFHYDEMRIDFGYFPIELHEAFRPATLIMNRYQVLLLALAAIALLWTRRSPRLLIIASMPAYHIAVHYSTQLNPRYAYLGAPALVLLAGVGAVGLWMTASRLLRRDITRVGS